MTIKSLLPKPPKPTVVTNADIYALLETVADNLVSVQANISELINNQALSLTNLQTLVNSQTTLLQNQATALANQAKLLENQLTTLSLLREDQQKTFNKVDSGLQNIVISAPTPPMIQPNTRKSV